MSQVTENQINADHPLAPVSREQAVRRLLEWADHLEDPTRPHHREFDFSQVVAPAEVSLAACQSVAALKSCGTIGCAAGEAPYCWPRVFRFDPPAMLEGFRTLALLDDKMEMPGNVRTGLADDICLIATWLGLDTDQAEHLMIPEGQDTDRYGGWFLDANAQPDAVVENIRSFCLERFPDLYTSAQHEQWLEKSK